MSDAKIISGDTHIVEPSEMILLVRKCVEAYGHTPRHFSAIPETS